VKASRVLSVVATAALIGALLAVPARAEAPQQKKFTGDPITVMTFGEFDVAATASKNPEWPGAVKARAQAINKAGGLEDASGATHQVKVLECNTGLDPNKARACAQEAVDEGVVAVLGANTLYGDQTFPLLEAAGIASIGTFIGAPIDAASPVSFPLSSGLPGVFTGLPAALGEQGAENVGAIIPDLGAATGVAELFMGQGATTAGVALNPAVLIPPDATDLAPYVASGTGDDVDGVVTVLIGDVYATLLQQVAASGYEGLQATQAGIVTAEVIEEAGDAAEGLLLVGATTPFTNTKVPGVKMFRKDMKAYDSSLPLNDTAIVSWASMWVLERVAEKLATIDAASVLDAMGKVNDLDMGGITPPLSTTEPSGIPLLERMYNPTVVFSSVKNGKIKQLKADFFDPFVGEFVTP
jgi:branched-chain amino acid transport system substrate-binding protein